MVLMTSFDSRKSSEGGRPKADARRLAFPLLPSRGQKTKNEGEEEEEDKEDNEEKSIEEFYLRV